MRGGGLPFGFGLPALPGRAWPACAVLPALGPHCKRQNHGQPPEGTGAFVCVFCVGVDFHEGAVTCRAFAAGSPRRNSLVVSSLYYPFITACFMALANHQWAKQPRAKTQK